MKNVLSLLVVLCTSSPMHAQTNTFQLSDTSFTRNAVYTCSKIDFYNDCSNLFNRIQIDSIKNFLRINKSIKIEIRCHTDQRGSAEYNKALTSKYAIRLKEILVDSTISADRITAIGYGETEPLVDSTTIESYKTYTEKQIAYEKNRRFEIIIKDL